MRPLVAVVAIAAASCGLERVDPCAGVAGTCLAIQVEPSDAAAQVDQLAVSVSGDGIDRQKTLGNGSLLTLPVAIGVALGPLPRSPVEVSATIVAVRAQRVSGSGAATATLSNGEHQTITIRLDGIMDVPSSTVDLAAPPDLAPTDSMVTDDGSPDSAPQCSSDLSSDPLNCGRCGLVCLNGSLCSRGACTTSFAYPTNGDGKFTAARDFALTIQSLAPSTIYYTTDGKTPSLASSHGPSPLTLAMSASGVVKWFTTSDPAVREHAVTIDPALRSQIGELADQVRFAKSGGPIVFAAPGETLTGKINEQVWNGQGYCPGCVRVYGIGIVAVEQCLGALVPGNWQGTSWNDFGFTVHAPAVPGVYHLRRGINLDFNCHPGTGVWTDDGLVIVK